MSIRLGSQSVAGLALGSQRIAGVALGAQRVYTQQAAAVKSLVMIVSPTPTPSQVALRTALLDRIPGLAITNVADTAITQAHFDSADGVIIPNGATTATIVSRVTGMRAYAKPIFVYTNAGTILGTATTALAMVNSSSGLPGLSQTNLYVQPEMSGSSLVVGKTTGSYAIYGTAASVAYAVDANLPGDEVRVLTLAPTPNNIGSFYYLPGTTLATGAIAAGFRSFGQWSGTAPATAGHTTWLGDLTAALMSRGLGLS